MSEMDNLLDGIYDKSILNNQREVFSYAYEDKVIRKLLRHLGLNRAESHLYRMSRELTGKSFISCNLFNDQLQDFPLYLSARRLSSVYTTEIKHLYKKFTSTPFFKAWEELNEIAPPNKPKCVIFDWPGVTGTQMMIHDMDVNIYDDDVLRICKRIKKGKLDTVIWLDQFETVLNHIRNTWHCTSYVNDSSK